LEVPAIGLALLLINRKWMKEILFNSLIFCFVNSNFPSRN
jgi:hypothetical protein